MYVVDMTWNIPRIACTKPIWSCCFVSLITQRDKDSIMHRNIDCRELAPVDLPRHTLLWRHMRITVFKNNRQLDCSAACSANIKEFINTLYFWLFLIHCAMIVLKWHGRFPDISLFVHTVLCVLVFLFDFQNICSSVHGFNRITYVQTWPTVYFDISLFPRMSPHLCVEFDLLYRIY